MVNRLGPVALSISVFKDLVLKDFYKLQVKKAQGHPNVNLGLKRLCEKRFGLLPLIRGVVLLL